MPPAIEYIEYALQGQLHISISIRGGLPLNKMLLLHFFCHLTGAWQGEGSGGKRAKIQGGEVQVTGAPSTSDRGPSDK